MRFRLVGYSTTVLALSSTHLSSPPTTHGGLHTVHITYVQIQSRASTISRLLSWQKSTNNLERDETYIPPTRKDFKLPDGKIAVKMDYTEVLEETPAFTLFKMFVRQFL